MAPVETVRGRADILALAAALGSGLLLTLMVHFNGELGRHGGALFASWTAHGTGTVAALLFLFALPRRATPASTVPRAPLWAYLGGLVPPGAAAAPWFDYIGGPIGVVFVAAGSWLIPRIGAAQTAILIIAGQMISGVVLDMLFAPSQGNVPWILVCIALILAGVVVAQRGRQ